MLLLLALFVVGSFGQAFTQAEIDDMVGKHNAARRQYGVPDLVWDASVAAQAQSWSAGCSNSHSGAAGLGENIASASPNTRWPTYEQWESEKNYWTCSLSNFGGCSQGTYGCLHWTQILAKRSTKIGCGHTRCNGFSFLVCNYSPEGNFNIQTTTPVNTCNALPVAAPVAVPTAAPTKAPTAAPTNAPTVAPTRPPTAAPTLAPVTLPVAVPTAAPTKAPTAAPVAVPVAAPVSGPSIISISVPSTTIPSTGSFSVTVSYSAVQAGSRVTVDIFNSQGMVWYGIGTKDVAAGSGAVTFTVWIYQNAIPALSTIKLKAWIVSPNDQGNWNVATGAAQLFVPVSVYDAPPPTAAPTNAPTAAPTAAPTLAPVALPVAVPTNAPTAAPTKAPTAAPVAVPVAVGGPACYQVTDLTNNPHLNYRYYWASSNPFTPQLCASQCAGTPDQFKTYGLQTGAMQSFKLYYCLCYAGLPTGSTTSSATCNSCGGAYNCGADNAIAVYQA